MSWCHPLGWLLGSLTSWCHPNFCPKTRPQNTEVFFYQRQLLTLPFCLVFLHTETKRTSRQIYKANECCLPWWQLCQTSAAAEGTQVSVLRWQSPSDTLRACSSHCHQEGRPGSLFSRPDLQWGLCCRCDESFASQALAGRTAQSHLRAEMQETALSCGLPCQKCHWDTTYLWVILNPRNSLLMWPPWFIGRYLIPVIARGLEQFI